MMKEYITPWGIEPKGGSDRDSGIGGKIVSPTPDHSMKKNDPLQIWKYEVKC